MDESDNIRDRIRTRLEALDLSVQTASKKAELGQTTLRDFLVGRAASITLRTLTKLAPILECSPEWLHTGREATTDTDDPESAELLDIFLHSSPRKRSILLGLAREISDRKGRG